MSPLSRRQAIALGAAALAAPALAQTRSPRRLLVGFPAGGTIDAVARLLAEHLSTGLGTPVVVDNRTGAGGQLAAQALRQAPADGSTLLLSPDHTLVMLPLTVRDPGFDAARDFASVGPVATYAGAIAASPATGANDLAALLSWARATPDRANVGVPAPGSIPQFLVFALAQHSAVPLTAVPYRGSAPLVQDLLGGQIAAGTTALGDFLEHARAGTLRVVASVGRRRSPLLPAVPTLTEQGVPLAWDYWLGMFARAGTPPAERARLNGLLRQALDRADIVSRMQAIAFEPAPGDPAILDGWVQAGQAQWAPIVRGSGWQLQ